MPQRAAIELLVGGLSVTEVADRVGVNRSTIARWKRDDAFAQEHDIRMQQSVTELRARMPGMLNKAIDVLQAQLDDGDPGIALQFLRLAFRYGASSPATANALAPPLQEDVPSPPTHVIPSPLLALHSPAKFLDLALAHPLALINPGAVHSPERNPFERTTAE
jgi:transcriptional regulator with XRE-family HTH domain